MARGQERVMAVAAALQPKSLAMPGEMLTAEPKLLRVPATPLCPL